jgi:PIN like domain
MRSVLPEWYAPDNEALELILTTGTIALDANVLLDLYRVGRDQRDEILAVLREVGARLWVPYQAALEFQRNRLPVVAATELGYEKIVGDLRKLRDTAVQSVRDPALRNEIERSFVHSFTSFEKKLAKLREEHTIRLEDARTSDPVREALDELLVGDSVGRPPSEDELAQRRRDAATRLSEGVPPGRGDSRKPDSSGDYLIWAELLARAKDANCPVLFVTNDEKKGDWYSEFHGQTIGPLPALVAEMAKVSKHSYHQTTLDGFLRLANRFLGASVKSATIETVEAIAPSLDPGLEHASAPSDARTGSGQAGVPDYPSLTNELMRNAAAGGGLAGPPDYQGSMNELMRNAAAGAGLAGVPDYQSFTNEFIRNAGLSSSLAGSAGYQSAMDAMLKNAGIGSALTSATDHRSFLDSIMRNAGVGSSLVGSAGYQSAMDAALKNVAGSSSALTDQIKAATSMAPPVEASKPVRTGVNSRSPRKSQTGKAQPRKSRSQINPKKSQNRPSTSE